MRRSDRGLSRLAGLFLALVACGGCPSATPHADDAALKDASPNADAWRDSGIDRSDSAPYAGVIWERVLHQGFPEVAAVVSLDTGVAVVADPEVYLYDSTGNQVAHVPKPVIPGNALPEAAIRRQNGDLAVLYASSSYLAVRTYAPPNLDEVEAVDLEMSTVWGGAIAEVGGRLYLLEIASWSNGGLLLYDLAAGPPHVPRAIVGGEPYTVVHSSGLATPTGDLLFCVTRRALDSYERYKEVLRINPSTGATIVIPLTQEINWLDSWCFLAAGDPYVAAMWQEGDWTPGDWPVASVYPTAALLDVNDGSVVVPARRGPEMAGRGGGINGLAFAGGQFMGIDTGGEHGIFLYPVSSVTGAWLPLLRVALQPEDDILSQGAGIAWNGANLFVAFAPSTPFLPTIRDLRLQKLERIELAPPNSGFEQ